MEGRPCHREGGSGGHGEIRGPHLWAARKHGRVPKVAPGTPCEHAGASEGYGVGAGIENVTSQSFIIWAQHQPPIKLSPRRLLKYEK